MSVFETATLNAFGYLVSEFGYKVVEQSPGVVVYRGSRVVVTIRHDFNRSYELALDFGEENQLPPHFNFGEALRACGAPAKLPASYQVSAETKLPKFVDALAGSLRSYCCELLLGAPKAFQQLRNLREAECETFGRERELRYARDAAGKAWSLGDYQQVVNVLKPHDGSLSKPEKMKLEIARKKVAGVT